MQIELSELIEACGGNKTEKQELPFEIGEQYFVRTVTLYYTGRVVDIIGKFLVLEDAAWIADTGPFSECLAKCECGEVEPYPGKCLLNADSIIDASVWTKQLPTQRK